MLVAAFVGETVSTLLNRKSLFFKGEIIEAALIASLMIAIATHLSSNNFKFSKSFFLTFETKTS